MNGKRAVKISKFLSLVLRHKPEEIGLILDGNGWANVADLLERFANANRDLTFEELEEIVETNDKKRFSFDETKSKIRASQGHSLKVELEFEEKTPPPILYHGTADRNLDSIFAEGLNKRSRHHVHLSTEIETARTVGARYGKPLILQIDAARMAADGYRFYVSENGVWLTDQIPVKFLKVL